MRLDHLLSMENESISTDSERCSYEIEQDQTRDEYEQLKAKRVIMLLLFNFE